jgi:ribosome-associated protein
MNETKALIETIKNGIQEKKGKHIVIADLTHINDTICNFLVICEGDSTLQVNAIANSIKDLTTENLQIRPLTADGETNAEWIAMDYADVIVHIFLPDRRAFYNLEHLWADAKLTNIPDID